jgi:ribosome production factor 1
MGKPLSEYKNKNVRSLMYSKIKKEKNKVKNLLKKTKKKILFFFIFFQQEKKKSRQENKDKPKQIPKTIENCRIIDDTYVKNIENDEDIQVDFESDELSSHLNDNNKDPKILITTTDMTISCKTYKLCRELEKVLPNAQYFYRKNVPLQKIMPEAIKREYSAIIVINQDRKVPSKLCHTFFNNLLTF